MKNTFNNSLYINFKTNQSNISNMCDLYNY